MFNRWQILLLIFFASNKITAQVLPREGSVLNYRMIGFTFPCELAKANPSIHFEIANGNYNDEREFSKHIIRCIPSKTNSVIAELPSFGCSYTWRVSYKNAKGNQKSTLCHFSTGQVANVDTTLNRLRVLKPTEQYEAFVFLDNTKALYDMKGHPVWYLPEIKGVSEAGMDVRDLKVSPAGTITFIGNNNVPYEITFGGEVLWKGPDDGAVSGEQSEHYHHEFTRLSNGHFMVLGSESNTRPTVNGDTQSVNDATTASPTQFGTLIEYDRNGKVVWTWRSYKYFAESDLANYKPVNGTGVADLHENSFFFDEVHAVVYISFKNVSRILKVKYPEGVVLNTIGEKYKQGVTPQGNGLFCGQHACKYSQIGCLFLFNNNGCNPGGTPKVKILKEQSGEAMGVKKIWEYDCVVEGNYPHEAPAGGNVIEMPDHSAFVSMGGSYSKVFIVNMDKKELWSALPERWVAEEKKWYPIKQYRASIINDHREMEQLIWGQDTRSYKLAWNQ